MYTVYSTIADIHLINTYVLNNCSMMNTVLDPWDVGVDKIDKIPDFMKLTVL